MFRKKVSLLIAICVLCLQGFSQRLKSAKETEKMIANVVDSAYLSCVRLYSFDTIKHVVNGTLFSGVAVSAEGHILTVAHATKPNQTYQVVFPDGKEYIAIGLGRIALKDGERDLDLSIIKMVKPGQWPFAKMGWNSKMKMNQPAVSISYPGSLQNSLPSIRFGKISNVDFSSGYFESTCKMEPGDSGGPIFDMDGKIIGTHSWVKTNEDQNFEVPVDLYRMYWTALNKPIDYKSVPEQDKNENIYPPEAIKDSPIVMEMASLSLQQFRSTVVLKSSFGGYEQAVLGTLIKYKKAGSSITYILSKNSMIGSNVYMRLNGKVLALSVIGRDRDNDLILLKHSKALKDGVSLQDGHDVLDLNTKDLGKILISSLENKKEKVGVLSTLYIRMPLRFSVGNFGANATFIENKIIITNISKGSASSEFLMPNDQVTGVNGLPISQPEEYGFELSKYMAGDSITIEAVRAGVPFKVKMLLAALPGPNHIAYHYTGGRSSRSDGFNRVFVHDAAITPQECGSPVFDLSGRFYGINIARHSRTSTIVMPIDVITGFLNRTLNPSQSNNIEPN
jgi:serine protease Do